MTDLERLVDAARAALRRLESIAQFASYEDDTSSSSFYAERDPIDRLRAALDPFGLVPLPRANQENPRA